MTEKSQPVRPDRPTVNCAVESHRPLAVVRRTNRCPTPVDSFFLLLPRHCSFSVWSTPRFSQVAAIVMHFSFDEFLPVFSYASKRDYCKKNLYQFKTLCKLDFSKYHKSWQHIAVSQCEAFYAQTSR